MQGTIQLRTDNSLIGEPRMHFKHFKPTPFLWLLLILSVVSSRPLPVLGQDKRFEELRDKGEALLKSGQMREAISYLRQAADTPHHPEHDYGRFLHDLK